MAAMLKVVRPGAAVAKAALVAKVVATVATAALTATTVTAGELVAKVASHTSCNDLSSMVLLCMGRQWGAS